MTSSPVPGVSVLLDLNDQARAEFGDRIGSSVRRVEGVVREQSDTSYMLRMSSVTYLDGTTNKWSGEYLTIPSRLVATAQAREFSRSRTSLLGAGIATALAVIFASTNFLGRSGADQQPLPAPGGAS